MVKTSYDFHCCLPHKGTIFLANHNSTATAAALSLHCCLPHKGTIFLANHNLTIIAFGAFVMRISVYVGLPSDREETSLSSHTTFPGLRNRT